MTCSLAFDGISRPIALVGCAHLQACLAEACPGWRFASTPAIEADPIILIRRDGDRYRLESPWLDQPFDDPTEVGIVCDLILDLIRAYVAEHPSLFCLHCGAAELGGRLVVFPSWYRAGKSTLVARLAAAGVPVHADDVLPVTAADHGVALGIAPRLRLPLPRNAGRLFRRFVERQRGPGNHRYLYLKLPPGMLAPHGRTTPIGAFVLLDRARKGGAALEPAAKATVLQRVILQHFARSVAATEIVERLHALVQRVPCFVLRYARIDDAVALLQDAFDPSRPVAHEDGIAASARPLPMSQPRTAEPPQGDDGPPRYQRHPAVVLNAVDDELFLVDPRSEAIYHLNPVAAGLWRLLGERTTADDAIEVLRAAFPAVDRRQIERDVTALLADLSANRLVVAHPPGEAECSVPE